MSRTPSRRSFVRTAATLGTAVGLGDLSSLTGLAAPGRARWEPDVVRFHPQVEPLVRLLEETPRDRVLEVFAERIHGGTSYQEVLAALHLAGIRNIPPRPDVGWKFHCVLVLHSAHLAALAAPEEDRWLPIFFALDFFKSQQAYDVRESDWSMGVVDESAVPDAAQCRAAFVQAMDDWDDEAADAAAAGWARTAGPADVFELFAHYGMRDFRNIGHKPIYLANGWRTLDYLGWQHAEPMTRSLVYAFLNHHDQPNPAKSDLEADAPWRENQERIDEIGAGWTEGELDAGATSELLDTLRSGTWSEASAHTAEILNGSASPQTVLDALFAGAAELLLRQPGIVSLHGMTATNGLAWTYREATTDRTRRLLLLQNAAFLVQFRDELATYGAVGSSRIDELEPAAEAAASADSLDEIFGLVQADPGDASRKALAFLKAGGSAQEFMEVARYWNLLKCQNGHHFKFSSAVFEDYARISPGWRDRYLAASVHYLRGSTHTDNALVSRTREALSG